MIPSSQYSRWTRFVVCIALTVASVSQVSAQTPDRVWLQPTPRTSTSSDWYPQPIAKTDGEVVDLDATQLRLIVAGDEVETIVAASRVIWIQPGDVSSHQSEAVSDFFAGRFAESLKALPEVLKQRPPVWRQQWLTMMGAEAARRTSRGQIALELVSQLDARPLPPLVIAWLPIAWQNGSASADLISAAKGRLNDPSPAVRLVAASWLLSSPHRADAITVVDAITSDTSRPRLAQLAACLRWRSASPPEVKQSYQQWQSNVQSMPMVLQVGPTMTLIDKLGAAGLADAASPMKLSLELTPIHPHPSLLDWSP
ncbi:hypothetical protein K227x_00260 [Rubripirellula lacrimiformis]|uniref:HEAT repeat protein n=1 Tax=Rubripirellula lacrimiformis TaxID=1930273 RepID=A0A517N3E5_9BACT|nr:hypothetical protein [Rubripirellula lacrimiformis]QDT01659.1 hypothetical protein K227x_00260 [Rubripirellula lacrimiformis]